MLYPTVSAHFSLADNLYAKAHVLPENKVCLWLGANVMLEYTYDEAEQLLTKNLNVADTKLVEIQDDLDFLRNNVITTEVNIARTYNYDVRKRKKALEAEKGTV